ncbi:MAG TPA: LuxR C-terminal-related transcriptional regulator, partial [Solirubrobacteraceae bacterium]|nr:LuxR C-terminal-related transcriptional regulator [Solirubrobacteraceae bacterium]
RVSRVTGGNPFLVVETISAGERFPESVRAAALARVGRLSARARETVEAAAVAGQRVSADLLEALVPGSAEPVEEALQRGVMVADGNALGFRHELIRDAIELSIAPPRRASLHASVARVLMAHPGGPDHARIAHHAELAGLAAEAAHHAGLAARDALRVGALREAALQSERALRLGEDLAPQERADLLITRSRAANFAIVRLEEAAEAAEEAIALARELGDPVRLGRALIALAYALWSLDRVIDARAAAADAVSVLEPAGELQMLAQAHATLLRIDASAVDPARALERAARAVELAAAAELEETRIDVEISLGLARGHLGERSALDVLERACAAARRAGLPIQTVRSYVNQVFVGVLLREHAFVDATTAAALALFAEYGTVIPGHAIELYRARSLLDRGRWEEALTTIERPRGDWVSETPVAGALSALIAARRGQPGAEERIEQAWRELSARPESSRHGVVRVVRAEVAWLRGDGAGLARQLAAARSSPVLASFTRPAAELALWAARCSLPFDVPANPPEAIALELAGDWRGAVRAWRQVSAPYEAALAALPGDERAAREALAALHRLGAAGAARAFARHRAQGGARAPRGPRRSTLAHPAGLTRREQEVLDHLATGVTNAEIAAALHVSERTVDHHVSAILAKLDARTRLAAIEKARALGLLAQDGQGQGPR